MINEKLIQLIAERVEVLSEQSTMSQHDILSKMLTHTHSNVDLPTPKELETLCRGSGHYVNGVMANLRGLIEITQLKYPDLPETITAHFIKLLQFTYRGEYFAELIRLYGLCFSEQVSPLNLSREMPRLVNDAKMTLSINFPVVLDITTNTSVKLNHELFDGTLRGLIKNAFQAIQKSERTPPSIRIEVKEVDDSSPYLSVSVIDNGVGMDEKTKAQATTPFFTTNKANQAVGLGLTIVNNMLTQYKGRLVIDSQPGEGSHITMQFPRGLCC